MASTAPATYSDQLIRVDTAHPDLAYCLTERLREVDKEEMLLMHPGQYIYETLHQCVADSDHSFAIFNVFTNVLHGLGGHGEWQRGPFGGHGFGYVWLLSDDALFKHFSKHITKTMRDSVLPSLDSLYPSGYGNFVLTTNTTHLRWLSMLGFHSEGIHTFSDRKWSFMVRKECG